MSDEPADFLSDFDGGRLLLGNVKTDRDLLESYVGIGDEAAFAELVNRHIAVVYGAALRQVGGDAHLAADVCQAVFIDLARKASSLPDTTIIAGWLYVSTRYAAANAVRSERRRRAIESEAQHMIHEHGDASDAAWRQIRPELDEALSELDPADREAVILRYLQSKPYREIGAELALKEDTARARVERALDRLATILRRRGVTSSAEALALALTAHGAVPPPNGLASLVAGLATAAAGKPTLAASAVKAVTFMSKVKLATAAAMVVALCWLGSDLLSIRRQVAALRDSAAQLDRDVATATAAATRVKPPEHQEAAPPPAKKTPPPGALATFSDGNAMGDPEYAPIVARRQQRYAYANARPVIDALHLSSAEAAKLKVLIAARWLAQTDASDVLDRMGNKNGELRQKAGTAATADTDQAIKDLLGPERFAQFKEATEVSAVKGINWALFTDFWDSGIPLAPEQKNQLAEALVDSGAMRYSTAAAARDKTYDATTGLSSEDERLLDAAGKFLSPEQVAFIRERRAAEGRYQLAMRARTDAKRSPQSSTP